MATLLNVPLVNGLQKTLDAQLDSGTTASVTLNNTTNIQSPGVFVVNRIDANGNEKSASEREFIKFTGVSGNTLTGLTRNADGGTSDQDHAVGSIVEFVADVVWAQALADVIETEHNSDGTHASTIVKTTATQTLTNKTLTSPTVNSPRINEDVALTATSSDLNKISGGIEIAAELSDVSAEGIKITLTTAQNVAFGDVCYIASNGKATLVDADAISSSSGVCMAIESINADESGNFLLFGVARNDSWDWTVGGVIYITVSGTTGNTMSQIQPSDTDDVIQIVGVATHADRMFFNPQLVQVELT